MGSRKCFFLSMAALVSIAIILFSRTPTVYGVPTGTNFDHLVVIAMENQPYSAIVGTGNGTVSDPFISSMLPSSAVLDMNSYPSTISGCSAGCYTAFTAGNSYGVANGVLSGSVNKTSLFDRLGSSGLSWAGFCESNCPRNGDHDPCLQYSTTYNSPNCVTLTSGLVGNSQILSTFNKANPPNYIWLIPTDANNMHDNSVSSGDAYLKSLLVGSGSLTSPSAGSLLSTSLFTNPTDRTLLLLWWDECSSNCTTGQPFNNNDKAEIYYGSTVNQGLVDKTTQYTDYNALRTLEDNWGLNCLSNDCNPTHYITNFFKPDFSLTTTSPAEATVGLSATSTITIGLVNNFAGTISLSDSIPTGLSCGQINPSSFTTNGTAAVSCTSSTAGNYSLTIIGAGGGRTHSATSTFMFGDFAISLSSPYTIDTNQQDIATVQISSINHFGGPVSLTHTMMSGLSCGTMTPSSLTGSGQATLSCSAGFAGNFTIQIKGTTGTISHSTSETVDVADFSVSTSSNQLISPVGTNTTSTISIGAVNDYSGRVNVTANILSQPSLGSIQGNGGRPGIAMTPPSPTPTYIVTPSTLIFGQGGTMQTSLTLILPPGTTPGNYTIIVSATDGTASHGTQLVLTVTDFSISTSASNATISPGGNSTITLRIQSLSGYQGSLNLSSSFSPAGPVANINPATIFLPFNNNITLTVSVPPNTPPGNYTLTVRATSGALSHTTSITISVKSGFTNTLTRLVEDHGFLLFGITGILVLALLMCVEMFRIGSHIRTRNRVDIP